MKKSERIFKMTRAECKKQMEIFGKQFNDNGDAISINSLCCRDSESMSTRTFNDVQKVLDSTRKTCVISHDIGVISETRFCDNMHILDMVQVALEKSRNRR